MKHTRRDFLWRSSAVLAASAVYGQTSMRIRTIAGTGTAGAAPDGASADSAPINNPYGLVIGPDGALYWADFGSNRVLRLDERERRITVIAGNGTKGHSGDGGSATLAQLSAPHEVRFDSHGNIVVAERDSHVVRRRPAHQGHHHHRRDGHRRLQRRRRTGQRGAAQSAAQHRA